MAARTRQKGVRSALEQELKDIQRRIAEAEGREEARIGKLATQAGLTRLELDESVILDEFRKLAARFQEADDDADAEQPQRGHRRSRNGAGAKRSGEQPIAAEGSEDGSGQPASEAGDARGADQAHGA